MSSKTRKILVFELSGAVFMIVTGSALHFLFEWVGGWPPAALIAAVNESIWEHLKLAFWPGLFWASTMPRPLGVHRRDLLAAKGISLFVTAVLIVVIFTSYTAILGRNLLALDIGTFVVAILVGQVLSAALLASNVFQNKALRRTCLSFLGLQILAFSLFTFLAPDHWLFVEASSGLRGIPAP